MAEDKSNLPAARVIDRDIEVQKMLQAALRAVAEGRAVIIRGGNQNCRESRPAHNSTVRLLSPGLIEPELGAKQFDCP